MITGVASKIRFTAEAMSYLLKYSTEQVVDVGFIELSFRNLYCS